jgi:GNAT superfamily N-acetyltransferase
MQEPDFAELAAGAEAFRLADGARVTLRAVHPTDRSRLATYLQGLSVQSRRNRLFGAVSELSQTLLERMLHLDGPNGSMLLAFADASTQGSIVAEAMQLCAGAEGRGEIALSVADAWQGRGLGTRLLRALECRARLAGVRYLFGDVLRTNVAMKHLARKEGFSVRSPFTDALLIEIVKDLSLTKAPAPCGETFAWAAKRRTSPPTPARRSSCAASACCA